MDLLCIESDKDVIRALQDPVILADPRALRRLLELEEQYMVTVDYFQSIQIGLTPKMRKICLSWLMEVCEAENCEDSVFPLATNYLDRYLATTVTLKNHLQLVCCVCLLLATKLRQSNAISVQKLSAYTDHTFEPEQIVEWEKIVLHKLNWNLASVTSTDFLDIIFYRLPSFDYLRPLVRKHTTVFLHVAMTDFDFCSWPPSMLAVGSIGASIRGLTNIRAVWPHVERLHLILGEMIDMDPEVIMYFIKEVEEYVAKQARKAIQYFAAEKNATSNNSGARNKENEDTLDDNPETPTDVKDVHI